MTSSAPERRGLGRRIRVGVLLLVLAVVAFDAWIIRARATSWETPLRISVHPLVGDGRPATREYVAGLSAGDFSAIEDFMRREGRRHGLASDSPVRILLRPALERMPPAAPSRPGVLAAAGWSLKLRWYAMRVEQALPRPRGQVRLFVLYYDPAVHETLAHSLGLKEGLIGVVHAFASRDMTPTNNVVIAHELLHTLGASDKYAPGSGLPLYPDGYAEPGRQPRHPQPAAELMAGRIALAPDRAEIPESLAQVVVGPRTAAEIGWPQP
jgi:hypothetical protein